MRWDLLAFYYLGGTAANVATLATGHMPTNGVVAFAAALCIFGFLMDRRSRRRAQ